LFNFTVWNMAPAVAQVIVGFDIRATYICCYVYMLH